ncbi:hypothetical protein GCM10010435_25840 [Winogradskya consettensis]|uniref:Uncharacterized protein n=1 Tax=Winogradskya consettensis TaxID=113560 RepID=A0A919VSL9_9ACTN|nr:hypothetical protein [Actinoplanes consettensis]GIM67964.1 hypothetical protein Aco04nite_08630 [Actinoplanes consettensis]
MRRTAEFDAFGPWIHQVHSISDLPRLFQDSGVDPAAHRLVLKVPRNIERRNATPDMDLYDSLIAVDYETVTILRRHGTGYDGVRIPMDRITAIEDSVSMLDGRLTLHTSDGTSHVIAYNAADLPPVQNLIQVLRESYLPAAQVAPDFTLPDPEPVLGDADTGLVNEYRRLTRAEPGMHLISALPRRRIGTTLLRPATLHATITIGDDRELQQIHRRDRITRGNDKVLSVARTILPRTRLTDLQVRPHERFREITVLVVNGSLEIPVPTGSENEILRA